MSPDALLELEAPGGWTLRIGQGERLTIIAGPCQLESMEHGLESAFALKEIAYHLDVGLIFKTSFDKANRTSGLSRRGLGLRPALAVFAEIRERVGVPILTDIHEPDQARLVSEVVDVLQIPAMLSRQTDLIVAAARRQRPVNIKKGQFMAPWDMAHAVAKSVAAGEPRVLVTERGSSFGYNALVVDMRSLAIMAEIGCPVVFDATHSVQAPGGAGDSSGGDRRFVPILARAAAAVGVAAIFMEVHEDPDRAPSDGAVMVRRRDFGPLVRELLQLDAIAKARPA